MNRKDEQDKNKKRSAGRPVVERVVSGVDCKLALTMVRPSLQLCSRRLSRWHLIRRQ